MSDFHFMKSRLASYGYNFHLMRKPTAIHNSRCAIKSAEPGLEANDGPIHLPFAACLILY
jgi:hypothetical protein